MRCLPLFWRAAAVLDLHLQTAAAPGELGIDACFLPLGFASDFQPYARVEELPDILAVRGLPASTRQFAPAGRDEFRERPIDLLFIGAPSERRRRFFAQSAAAFSRFTCYLHLPETGTQRVSDPTALNTSAAVGLAQRARIVLNLHDSEARYFEWQRIVHHGIWQRALVVTEPCTPVAGLRAGEHYLECPRSELPDLVTWLLRTTSGAARAETVRRQAYAALINDFDLRNCLRSVLPRLVAAVER